MEKTKEQYTQALIQRLPWEEIKEVPFFQNRGAYFMKRALIPDKQGELEFEVSDLTKRLFEAGQFPKGMQDNEERLLGSLTTLQWLVTNCGLSSLDEILKIIGQKRTKL